MTLPTLLNPFPGPVIGMPEPATVTVVRGNDNLLRQRVNDLRDYAGQAKAPIATVTADTVLSATADGATVLVDASAANRTITLPPVADANQRTYTVKKIDATANTVTVDGNLAETIDGAATFVLTLQYQSVTVQCDGAAWWIL